MSKGGVIVLKSKIILITGATGGIGKETARALARQGHTVVIHGRNKVKTQQVCEEIKSETGNIKVDMLLADLLLLSDVKYMADEFKKKYDRLDVLINNAGAMMNKNRETTKEGLEKTIVVNLLAPFLLTELLLVFWQKALQRGLSTFLPRCTNAEANRTLRIFSWKTAIAVRGLMGWPNSISYGFPGI